MMRVSALVSCAIVLVAAPCMAAQMDLPEVTLGSCTAWTNMSGEGASLIATLGLFITGLPTFDQVDLENGANGDGLPDKYPLALLAALLCNGNPTVAGQVADNTALYLQLVDDVALAATILMGNGSTVPNAAVRLDGAADILVAVFGDPAPTEIQAIIDALRSAADEVQGVLDEIPSSITPAYIPTLKGYLVSYQHAVGGIMGLSSDIQATVLNLLTSELLGQITSIRDEVVGIVAAVRTAATVPPFSTDQQTTLLALADDAEALVGALNRTMAMPAALKVYGVTGKAEGEPFAGDGDYDKDGNTNLATYQGLGGNSSVTVQAFVAAASGANPFWSGNTNLPVAGVFGLIALAAACGVTGVVSARKK